MSIDQASAVQYVLEVKVLGAVNVEYIERLTALYEIWEYPQRTTRKE
jgi:hypothetical protein